MLVVGDTSVGNTNGGPVDVGVGLSCKPTSDPRVGGSGHRCQAAALPPFEEERSSRGAAGSRMIHGCSLAESITMGQEKEDRCREKTRRALPSGRGGTWPAEKERERRGKASPCLNPRESL